MGKGETEAQEGGVVYVVVQQKLTQYCKVMMLQLKNKFKKKIVRTHCIAKQTNKQTTLAFSTQISVLIFTTMEGRDYSSPYFTGEEKAV